MHPPLSLMILRTVQEYGRIPKSLLYSRISAPQEEIERQIQTLAAEGALKVDRDYVSIGADDARGS
jgi:hypothetical protein